MIRKIHAFVFIMCLGVWITGCAVPVKKTQHQVGDLCTGYLQTGKHYESTGDLVAALRQFRLALTVDPGNQEAVTGCKRLEKGLLTTAEKHYNAGIILQKQGRYAQAKREFLTALRLFPDYQEARERLTPRRRLTINGYVTHKVSPGDTLSKLAAIYYGDHRKFSVIARYNNISDAAALRVGQKIKIPEIKGMEFESSKGSVTKTESEDMKSVSWDLETDLAAIEDSEPHEDGGVDQVTIYRDHGIELFNQGKHEKALIEFEKVLSSNPDDRIALDYAYKCSFRQAVGLYGQKDYISAKEQFRASLEYRTNCRQCHIYIESCENSYKELHYKKGMQLYDQERLSDAIVEWELVRKEDPDYKRVNYLINKAQTILKNLNKLKGGRKGE